MHDFDDITDGQIIEDDDAGSHFLEMLRNARCEDGRQDAGPVFMSVLEADCSLASAMGKVGGGKYYRDVARSVLSPGNKVFGNADQYFNFVSSYLSVGDFYTALDVAKRALELYPHNVDLLANALCAASGCARFDACEQFIAQLRTVPKKCWNWRAFLFLIRYYQAFLCVCEVSEIDAVLDEAIEVAHDYQRMLPLDERGYNCEAELLLFANRVDEAQEVLERAIFGTVTLPNGKVASLVAPSCCLTMLDRILDESTDYRLAVRVAQRGVRNTAQEQPTTNIGYFVYREALALDAQICDAKDPQDGYRNAERVRGALTSYRCAYGMLEDGDYRRTIERRYSILCHKSGIFDMPLVASGEDE
jgi:tetratricopeptide (TPR) repeat protein